MLFLKNFRALFKKQKYLLFYCVSGIIPSVSQEETKASMFRRPAHTKNCSSVPSGLLTLHSSSCTRYSNITCCTLSDGKRNNNIYEHLSVPVYTAVHLPPPPPAAAAAAAAERCSTWYTTLSQYVSTCLKPYTEY